MLMQTVGMLKNIRLLSPVELTTIIESPTFYQCVRWRRKPRWVPVAKSKMFRVPERHKTPEEELIELRRLQNNYNTQIKSIREYLREQVEKTSSTNNLAVQNVNEEQEFARCMKINEEWNAEVGKIREERLVKEAELRREIILQKLVEEEEKDKLRLEEIERIVREEKERAKSYITPDNIDVAIEKTLGSEVDYNFAIDLDGKVYRGRYTKPSDVTEQNEKLQIPMQSGT